MISPGRCDGGRTAAVMTKDCRLVNGGGGYVKHCEQALGDKNEMVVAVSKIAVGGDHHHHHQRHHHNNHHNHQTMAVANRVYSSELDTLKEFMLSNFDLVKELKVCLVKKDEKLDQKDKEIVQVSGYDGVRRIFQRVP